MLVALICIVIAYLFGVVHGTYIGAKIVTDQVIEVAQRFVDIDAEAISNALFQYENSIANCYPLKNNASILYN